LLSAYPCTTAAARLILRAQRVRAELRHALSDLSSLAGGSTGITVIGTLPMARADILPRAIGNCLNISPHLRIQVVEAQREPLLAQLRAGEIDAVLSVLSASFDPRDLVVEPLFADRLGVIAGRTHPLACASRAALRDIAAANWILPSDNAVSRALFDDQFVKRAIDPPRPTVQTGDLLIMRPLLARGDMLAFTSLSLVQFEIDAGLLVQIEADMDDVGREVVLLRREAAHLPASTLSLLAEIRAVAGRD
jgi:LysR family transcriptional regulator of gallate degradation